MKYLKLIALTLITTSPLVTAFANTVNCQAEPGTASMPALQVVLDTDAADQQFTFRDQTTPEHTITYQCSSDHTCNQSSGNITWSKVAYINGDNKGVADATMGERWIRTKPSITTLTLTAFDSKSFFTVYYDCPLKG